MANFVDTSNDPEATYFACHVQSDATWSVEQVIRATVAQVQRWVASPPGVALAAGVIYITGNKETRVRAVNDRNIQSIVDAANQIPPSRLFFYVRAYPKGGSAFGPGALTYNSVMVRPDGNQLCATMHLKGPATEVAEFLAALAGSLEAPIGWAYQQVHVLETWPPPDTGWLDVASPVSVAPGHVFAPPIMLAIPEPAAARLVRVPGVEPHAIVTSPYGEPGQVWVLAESAAACTPELGSAWQAKLAAAELLDPVWPEGLTRPAGR